MDNDITSVEDEAFDNLTNIKEINLAGKRRVNQVFAAEMKSSTYLSHLLKNAHPDSDYIESQRMVQHMLLQFPPEFYVTVGLVGVSLSTCWAED